MKTAAVMIAARAMMRVKIFVFDVLTEYTNIKIHRLKTIYVQAVEFMSAKCKVQSAKFRAGFTRTHFIKSERSDPLF